VPACALGLLLAAGPSSGHLAWLRAGWAVGPLEEAGVAAVVYPGGGVAGRSPALGVDARWTVASLPGGLGLHAGLLAGWGGAGGALGGGDLAPWSRRDTFLLAPAVGCVWAPSSGFAPGSAAPGAGSDAAPTVRLVLEARALNLSHFGLIGGVGVAL